MRFLMNTLLAHPIPSLIHAFPAKPSLGTLGSRRCLRVPAKPLSRDPRLPAWHNYSSQSFGASSILLFKAAGTLRYASKIAPCLVCASSRTVLFPDALATSGVGFVQPSSRSPRSPHLKSHSRQRRPTRLKVMQTITFDENVAPKRSYLNDVRLDTKTGHAFITESGTGAIIVVNLKSGHAALLVTRLRVSR